MRYFAHVYISSDQFKKILNGYLDKIRRAVYQNPG